MHKELLVRLGQTTKMVSGPTLVPSEPFPFAHDPLGQPQIQGSPDGVQRAGVELTVIRHPSPEHRVEHMGEVGQRLAVLELNVPRPHRAMHGLETAPTHGGREVDVASSIFIERFSRTKLEPEKLEPDVLVAAGTIDILTVDDLGFVRVDLQSTFLESCGASAINSNRKIFEARKRETAALGAGEKLVLGHPLAATIGDSARCMQNLEKVLFTGPKTSDMVTFICD